MTDTTDLAAWLRAQLDEDERLARATAWNASTAGFNGWQARRPARDDEDWEIWQAGQNSAQLVRGLEETHAQHIAAHDPERVLRAVAAKRRVVADYEDAERTLSVAGPGTPPHDIMTGATNTLRRILRLLAAEFADRPGYREEWRP